MNTIADELGIIPENLRRWIIELEEKGDKAFPGNGNVPDSDVRGLQKELHHFDGLSAVFSIFDAISMLISSFSHYSFAMG